ncbi:IS200/IS605 family element RNA-guided endonuclease TnpB [Paenibacillus ferrarius]|uniref:IS200/IS605 family element RNA-guided endonuclease TnpB n=1 Tax=Paenibacillus ferrarius TaxID=1469647 RepID=UPI003D2AAA68
MMHHKAYKYRIYPTQEQEVLFRKIIGSTRFVFNYFLARWNEVYAETGKGLSYSDCATQLPILKQTYPWLKEVDSIALQSAARHLSDAFDRFFKKQNQEPRFKGKRNPAQSYTTRYVNGNISIHGNLLQLPKVGLVQFANSREVQGRILSATVRLAPSGKWFVTLVCEVSMELLPINERTLGIDLGIKSLAVTTDGEVIQNPKIFSKSEHQLAKWQRRMARRKKGGRNWQKAKNKVARIHERIQCMRQDHLHKLTTKWIRENQTICLETLAIASMLKNEKLAKHISDAAWGELARQLRYKAKWYGRSLKEAPIFAPTSQTCHMCGVVQPAVKNLAVRTWTCLSCGTVHDRDHNAAHNIKTMAI